MRLGIDFGTTHTVVALVDRGNYPIVSFEWGDVTPSLLAVRDVGGEIRYGGHAADVLHEPGWSVLRSFKRLLVDAGPASEVSVGGRTLRLADVLASFLAQLREDLLERSNAFVRKGEPLEAAVSVPANASSAQRFLTVDAFRRAGFDVVALLNEPSAAGFEYAHRFRETVTSRREYVLVYDLGGGTFDASLIHMEGKANEVMTSSGVSRLGGDDIDEAMLGLVLARLGDAPVPEAARAAILDECRVQKENAGPNTRRFVIDLSAVEKEPMVLPADEVYAACTPIVEATVQAMEPAMRDPRRDSFNDVDWDELAGIYVVGGASSFPPVYRRLRERFGAHRVRRSPHPFGSTAIGLAIYLDAGAGYTLEERLSRHFGVFRESSSGSGVSFDVLIPKDTRLPAPGEPPLEITRRYRAAHNLGHFRFVECARIEEGRPEGNLSLWDEVLFPFDPTLRARADLGVVPVQRVLGDGPEIEEAYRCSAQGELEVQLRVIDDGYSASVRIGRRGTAATQ